MAIYRGLRVGINMELVNYMLESDSEMVLKQIWNGGNSEAGHDGILDAIQNFMAGERSLVLHCVHTKANKVALAHAKEALRINNMVVWEEDVSICIRAMVEAEQRI
ncbi:hypothetical protein Ddye_000483 [Dipteronia dyeriana]|uniref:RNase H type-1 domain-containing protein n=1 Tax=Dipteronia dyeriana TaxID=168575 RepID=A0AAD9XLU0_9ROSI|nr:hypothetical protein Ddye_000483 [Dipteronia dyeriana]